MSMIHGSRNGRNSTRFTNGGGSPSLARSSKHPEAKIEAGARAAYGSMMMGLADYDQATVKLQHKSREIAIAVLDATEGVRYAQDEETS